MKKIALAIAALSMTFTGAASAADMAVKARPAPIPVPVFSWAGFYLGINGGYGSARKCWDLTAVQNVAVPVFAEGCHDATGGTVGGQIGYRWQAANWVFGLEAQGNWADFRGSNTSNNLTFATAYTNRTKVDAFGLFTGQVGYAWNTFLLYVKGGAAVTNDKYDAFTNAPFGAFPTGTAFDTGSETRWGGSVGVGGEYAFTPNWSVGLEYNHLFMGNRNVTLRAVGNLGLVAGSVTRSIDLRQDVDIVTARINYKFGGPVVAKY